MNRTKKSIIWTFDKNQFSDIIKSSTCMADVCRLSKLRCASGNYLTIRRRIEEENIDISHFSDKRNKTINWSHISEEDFLNRLKTSTTTAVEWIKKKILEFDLIPYKCSKCQLSPLWCNEPLTLQLDHIDGNSTNHKMENLRFLCPNCHSQTSTYGGRKQKVHYCCEKCHRKIEGWSNLCFVCAHEKRRKVIRPLKEELAIMIKSMPMTKIAIKYNVSHCSVRKWCKSYGLDYKVGRGYWQKLYS